MTPDVLHGLCRCTDVARIVGARIACDQRPVPTEAGIHRHILAPIGTAVGDWIADHAGTDLELRQHVPGPGVGRFEPTIEGAVKDDIPGGHERAAPVGKGLLVLPYLRAARRIPRHEAPQVTAGPCAVGTGNAHEGRPLETSRRSYLIVHTEVVGGAVKQMCARRVRRWRGGADASFEARAYVLDVAARGAGLLG